MSIAAPAVLSPAELRDVVSRRLADTSSWADRVSHDAGARTFELLHRDESLELWLVCWMAGHDTGFHDHDESGAAIGVARGEVRELRLSVGEPIDVHHRAGQVVEIPPSAIHRVVHAGEAPSVTIHAYSPPLERMGAYEVSPDGALLRRSQSAVEELRAEG